MLQVATFLLPQEQDKANAFLAEHKPQTVNFNKDMVVVFFEDGTYPVAHEIADIQELIIANKKGRFQMEVALHLMEAEREELNAKHNKQKWDDLTTAIHDTKKQMDIHDLKLAFAEGKIQALKAQ